MGTCYKGLCHDCKEYVDLDKFYSFCPINTLADLEVEDLSDYDEAFIYRSLRLHLFLKSHQGHRLGVYRESDPEYEDAEEYEYTTQFPWPGKGRHDTDVIDLCDPKTPRVVLKTRYGEVCIDQRPDGVNCFRFQNGNRVDTLLLSATDVSIGSALHSTQQRFYPDNGYY